MWQWMLKRLLLPETCGMTQECIDEFMYIVSTLQDLLKQIKNMPTRAYFITKSLSDFAPCFLR